MAVNKFNKSANMRTSENRSAKMDNPLDSIEYSGHTATDARREMDKILEVFRQCDAGQHRGPLAINSPHFFTIAFESFEQRESFRSEMQLMAHGEQYWSGEAFMGSIAFLKSGNARSFKPRENPFGTQAKCATRENPFAKQTASQEKSAENAEKYSNLRAEVKRTQEKLKAYTEDRTWLCVCFATDGEMQDCRAKLTLPQGEFVHIDDILDCLHAIGIKIDVPCVDFGLRAVAKPDKALNQFVV